VSFLPIFTMEFAGRPAVQPAGLHKTFSMAAAAILSITLVPVLMVLFVAAKSFQSTRTPSIGS